MKKALIIGSGIGGLCTAIRLLKNGYDVTILEKESAIGGKINRKVIDGYKFDLTASILMTPHTYKEIFNYVNRDYREYVSIKNLDVLYSVNYPYKKQVLFYNDLQRTKFEIDKSKIGEFKNYKRFIEDNIKRYNIFSEKFLNKPMINISEVLNRDSINKIIKLFPFSNSEKYLKQIISNKELREYLLFQTMYIGINPYTNSNLYTTIPAITAKYGLCYIEGGIYNYILALEKIINEFNGKIITNKCVDKIIVKNKRACGVKVKDEVYKSDIVICNADYEYAMKNLLNRNISYKKYDKYSYSVFMIYIVTDKKYNDLSVHNIYISEKFKKSIEEPFEGKISNDPSIYIYCPSRIDSSLCGEEEEIINIMVRVPNLSFNNFEYKKDDIKKYRKVIFNEIRKMKGMDDIEKHIKTESYLTPYDLQNKFNCVYGNAFGLSHNLLQSIYFRPHLKSKDTKGLYFIGSSVHPGNGASIIINGSKVLVDIIKKYN